MDESQQQQQQERTTNEEESISTPLSSSNDERTTGSVATSPSRPLSQGISEPTYTGSHDNRMVATISVTPTMSGRPGQICSHCSTTISPLWRRTDQGDVVCNACGLYYKNRGHRRPVELKVAGARRKKKLATSTSLPGPGPGRPLKRRKFDETIMGSSGGGGNDSSIKRKLNGKRKTFRPLKSSRLPLTSLGDILTGLQQTKFQGRHYCTGEVVIVKGDDGRDYFLVISGFSIVNAEKYFRCFWLVPKVSSFWKYEHYQNPLTPSDYEVFTGQEYQLPMNVIKGVVFSPSDIFLAEQELHPHVNGDGNSQQDSGKPIHLTIEDTEAADALLLVRFANADWTTSRAF